jgi:ABC-type glycerol-3-phosphate transport system substrate-binding protein
MRRTLCILLLVAAAVVAGCGGSDNKGPSTGDAETTVREYLTALVEKKGKAACDKLTPAYQKSVVQQNQAFAKQNKAETCPQLIDAITRSAPSVAFEGEVIDSKAKVDKLDLKTSVRESGDQKNATVTGAQGIQRYELQTSDGRWLIAKIERSG